MKSSLDNLLKVNLTYANLWMGVIISIFAFILCSCLIDTGIARVVAKSVCLGMFLLCFLMYFSRYEWKIPFDILRKNLFDVIAFSAIIFFQILDGDYLPYYAIKISAWLLLLKYLLANPITLKLNVLFDRLIILSYILFTILIIYNFLFNSSFIDNEIVFKSIKDKNYTAIFMFLYFTFCYHFKLKVGLLLSIIYFLFYNSSRSIILLLLSFFLCIAFRGYVFEFCRKIKMDKFWRIFLVMTLCIIGFSFYWVSSVSTSTLQPYRQGLNDESNKMRFTANVYALDMLQKDGKLLYRGYGFDLKNIMGVADKDYATHPRINDVRLVQPHHSIINVVLRLGIIPGILYFIIVASILDFLYNKQTIEFIFPYLLNTMFMHSLLEGFVFAIWLIVVYMVWLEQKVKSNESRK